MGAVGSAYDNAMAESFFASLECELLDRTHFETREQARIAVFDYLEAWYNPTPPAFVARVHLAGGVREEVRGAGDHLMFAVHESGASSFLDRQIDECDVRGAVQWRWS